MNMHKQTPLVIGAPPRASLLPAEVGLLAKARTLRRGLVALVFVVVLAVGAGYAGAAALATQSSHDLEAATERTQQLIAEQAEYMEVRQVSSMVNVATQARRVGVSTEINWKSYMAEIQQSLPKGTTVTNFAADTATPMKAYQEPTVPLQGERIGQLTFTAVSKSLPDVEAWLNALAELTGFVDATPGSVVLDTPGADAKDTSYSVNISMHINQDALANRFPDEEK